MRTLTQDIMSSVWDRLCEPGRFGSDCTHWGDPAKGASSYLSAAKETAVRTQNCGLEQALAYLCARSGKTHIDWLTQDLNALVGGLHGGIGDVNLLLDMKDGDFRLKLVLTSQVVAVCEWMCYFLTGAGVKADRDQVPVGESEEMS